MRSLALCVIAAAFPISAFAGPASLQSDPDAARLYDLAARQEQYQSLHGLPAPSRTTSSSAISWRTI